MAVSGIGQDDLAQVKRAALTAILSDDDLTQRLVLKGGSALEMIYRVSGRSSIDLDFSMAGAFEDGELASVRDRMDELLKRAFAEIGLAAFDVSLSRRPPHLTADLSDFWGGYGLEFKLATRELFDRLGGDLAELRRRAVPVGAGGRSRFEIDISAHEYVEPKAEREVEGYTVYVYTPAMIVAEKLRAICQQMPEYGRLVAKRNRAGAPRARDFLDIYTVVNHFRIDMAAGENPELLREVFAAKRVPLHLLGDVRGTGDFHRLDWPNVRATVLPGVALKPFEDYFNFVAALAERLVTAS